MESLLAQDPDILPYAMAGSISHITAYDMHYMVFLGIPHDHMNMSHDHLVCHFDKSIPNG